MHPRILSLLEEGQIRAYLKANGEKNLNVRVLVSRIRNYLPRLKKDLALIKSAYEKRKAR